VIARNSTFTYKGKPVKVKQVSEELGVRYVLEGSVQKSGDRIRITVQLIDAPAGHHLWAERYERALKDLFAVQDEVTKKILTAMRVKLTEGDEAAWAEKYFQAHLGLTFAYMALGREKEARAEAAEVLRINPRFTTEGFIKPLPINDQSRLDKYIATLRKAGLK
jgi:tetratricopeptide (TPR) repeat protein